MNADIKGNKLVIYPNSETERFAILTFLRMNAIPTADNCAPVPQGIPCEMIEVGEIKREMMDF